MKIYPSAGEKFIIPKMDKMLFSYYDIYIYQKYLLEKKHGTKL